MALIRRVGATARSEGPSHRRALGAGLFTAVLVAGLVAPTVALAVNAPPSPGIDYITTAEDTPATGNVLANDTDPDGDTLTVIGYTPPTYGTMTIATNGDLSFTPKADYNGVLYPTYTVSDGAGGTHLGYIVITVTPVNDAPVAVDDVAAGTEDTPLVVTGATLAGNDTDVDGDTLAVTAVADATGGSVGLDAGSVTFTPTADLCGSSVGAFDYTVSDGNGGTDTGHVVVNLTCVNDAPVAVDDTALVDQASGPADYDVLANDTDIDGDTLTLVSASVPAAAGTATVVGGKVRYTPAVAFKGEANVSYVVSDGHLTDTGTLTVTVGPDVTAPTVAVPTVAFGSGRVNESAPIRITWSATDKGVGVASYEVQVNVGGAGFVPLYTGVGTTITKNYPFAKALVFRVRAKDAENNVSDWVSSPVRTIVAYQAPGSSAIAYTGTWTNVSTTSASGDRYRYTTTFGARANLKFTAFSVLYVAPRNASAGVVKVYVDGALLTRVSLRTDPTVPGAIIARKSWTTAGTHTIRIVNDSAGRRMNLDAFVVLR